MRREPGKTGFLSKTSRLRYEIFQYPSADRPDKAKVSWIP